LVPRLRPLLRSLIDGPATVVVVVARFVLACFALLAIWLDPTQPDRYPELTYSILALYVGHATVAALWQRASQGPNLPAHFADVALIGVLIYLTQGPTSPFFVLASFALISGTLQWGARGALLTGAALVLIQVIVTAVDGVVEIDRTIMRGGYLIVGAVLFAYYGMYRDRSLRRLAQLADWPAEDTSADALPRLSTSLTHAALVMQCRRVVVAWASHNDPMLFVSSWASGKQTDDSAPLVEIEQEIAPELAGLSFAVDDPRGTNVLAADGIKRLARSAISELLATLLGMQRPFISSPFHTASAAGRVFFINPVWLSEEVISLGNIVASRIGNEIHEHYLRVDVHESLIAKERVRLADDLHDSTLQIMTAATLELQRLVESPEGTSIRDTLLDIRNHLLSQQRQIRQFATVLRGDRSVPHPDLEESIDQALSRLEAIWDCETRYQVAAGIKDISPRMQRDVEFILMEAGANACRHGNATQIAVTAEVNGATLSLRIQNNGEAVVNGGQKLDRPQSDDQRLIPTTIRNRVASNGGTATLANTGNSVELRVQLPLT
jgi:signal transduction histidine kinase